MPDNTTLPGTGETIATEDIGGVEYQRVKLIDATVGATAAVGVDANPLRARGPDAIELLTQTRNTPTPSTVMDTAGYGRVVVQLSEGWVGEAIFEVSNGAAGPWLTSLVRTHDAPASVEMVNSGAMVEVTCVARYLRVNFVAITGSCDLVAIGRMGAVSGALDALALALDDDAPLHIAPGVRGGVPQAEAFPVTLSDDERNDLTYTLPVVVGVGINLLTGNQGWLDTQQYASLWITLVGNATSGSFVIEGNTRPSDSGAFGLAAAQMSTTTGVGLDVSWSNYGSTNTIPANTSWFVLPPTRFVRMRQTGAPGAGGNVHVRLSNKSAVMAPQSRNVVVPASTTLIGDVGLQARANATGAATPFKFNSAAGTNGASIKASAGRVLGWALHNNTASAKFFKLFNKASAATVGADTPVLTIGIPANGTSVVAVDVGLGFALGIASGCTGAAADLDTTATAVNDVMGSVFFA